MKLISHILLIVFTLLIASCGDYPCSKAELQFGLIGFSDTETDTIILRRFTKDGTPKDTFLLNNIQFQRNQDTLRMVAFPGSAILESDYNYEIFFPSAAKLIHITDIKEEQLYRNPPGKVGCMNSISGYTLNGQATMNIVPFDVIYFTK